MAACGDQSADNENQSEIKEPISGENEQQEENSENSEMNSNSDKAEPNFDTSWASNEFELQIAEPNFETWEVQGFTEGYSWSIFVKDVYYDAVKEYANDLRSYGFSLNEEDDDTYDGLAYIFNADNEAGYHVKLVFEARDSNGRGSFSLEISKN